MNGRTGRRQPPERAADARLGRAIRAVRHGRGLTLAQVAEATGLSQPFLSQLELGRTRPSMRSLFRIASALGTTQQALLAAAGDGQDDVPVTVGAGRARLHLHDPGGTDVTEFVGAPGEFVHDDLGDNPMDVLARWVAEARAAQLPMPSTMTLATAGPDGVPHARTVLVTDVDATSLRFHSSTPTSKTRDLAANPNVSAVFHWPSLGRQVVLQGRAGELDAATSRAAFPTQPRQLQLVAWVYEALLPGLTAPDYAVEPGAVEREFDAADADPRSSRMPPSWTTVRLVPDRADFWRAGTETTPPAKTRFIQERDGEGWRSFPVLP